MAFQPEHQSDQKRQWSYNILNAVIEGAKDAIFVKDIDGCYLMVNSACARFLNLPAENIVGKKDSDLYPPETAQQFQEQDHRVLSTGETHVFEGVASSSSTEQIYLVTKSVYRDHNGNITGLIGISHDITDRARAEEQKIALFKEQEVRLIAEEANRLKDEFLATLSHELRTPMACILGWASLLQNNDFDGETRNQALATIERNARAQMELIGDLLDVSRVITGHQPLKLREIDLVTVAQSALESVKLSANTKQIELKTNFSNEQINVIGDFNRLQQVIWNLLVNAIKFTPEGGRITLSIEQTTTNVEISITDTGQGIEPEFLPYVFERFRQANKQITQQHGGIGLGLAIVRHFVELHGGYVKAESSGKNKGAKFIVAIPLAADALETQLKKNRIKTDVKNESFPIVQPDLTGITVLVIDDELETVKMIEAALTSRGATVIGTSSIGTALKIIPDKKPDLIISDIEMKQAGGYSLIRKVRALSVKEGGKTPAIAFTACARESDRINAFLAGFQVHVSKPANPFELVAITASLTGKV
ncbi:MAG: ATP-binding protein [Acidobacteriota bacterium]|nr:ATP-binding protein [Acidobacteriota bacterium]